jgi:uncharacterized lipoprotein NlpE involved in copper resistance
MKNLTLLSIIVFLFFGCGNQSKKQQVVDQQPVVVLTVDELYQKAPDLVDKEVVVKGTVMHVCKEGGARCFLMGSNENINVRVEAGEKIGAFKQEQMGSDLEIVGILKEVKTEADAHNPIVEQSAGEPVDSVRAAAHKIIADAQEAAEVVYFIQGLTINEEKSEIK